MLTRKRRGGPATRLGAVSLSLALIFALILGISALVLAEEAYPEAPAEEISAETPAEDPETPGEETSGTPEAIETPSEEEPVEMPEAIETPAEDPVETPNQDASIGTLGTEAPADDFVYTESDEEITIVEYIGDEEEVVIPATIEGCPVTAIGDDDSYVAVFYDTLTAVTIPASVTSIGPNAFAYCYYLETVTFLGEAPEVGFGAFDLIGDDVFGGAEFHYHIAYEAKFKAALDDWEDYCTFVPFGSLTSISVTTLPQKLEYTLGQNLELTGMVVEAVYDGGLAGGTITVTLSKNDVVTDPDGTTALDEPGEQTVTVKYPKTGAGQKTATFTVTVTDGEPEATPDTAFDFTAEADGNSYVLSNYKGGYENVVVPKTYNSKPVTAIGDSAFSGYRSLKSLVLPDSVISIGKEAFYNCTGLNTLNLGKGVKTIGQMAFQYCNALETISLPATVETIGWNAFAFCKILKNIEVDENNGNFKDINGVLFSKNGKTLLYYSVAGRTAETYDVPEGTERIEEDAFRTGYEDTLSSALASVRLPTTLTAIGDRAFFQSSLQEVTVYPGIEMGEGVYELCKNLRTVNVEEGVTKLPKNIFYGLDNLEELTLPSTLEVIGESALERYPLVEINLPDGLKEIGNDAFASAKLTSVTIPASVTKLGDRAFSINGELETVTFAEDSKLTTINQYAFSDCKVLKAVTLPAGLTSLGTGVFNACYELTSITLPDGLVTLGDSVFAYTGIQTMTFPDNVTTIGSYVFYGCAELTEITLPKELASLGEFTFQYCGKLTNVVFPESVKIDTLPAGTFIDCFGLRELHLPAAIIRTEDAAFLNCVALTVEYETPRLLRSPLDLHNFILRDESFYDLWEDGFYHTNRDLQFGETLVPAGYKLEPQNNGVTFTYTGDPSKKIQPAIKSVSASPGTGGGTDVLGEIVAEGIQVGDKVQIKAVHKTGGYTVTGEGIVALGKEDNRGYFVAVKTLALDVGALGDYNVSASLDGDTWVGSGGQTVMLDYIRVTSPPAKTVYTVGETLDLTGMEVKAFYSDGSSETLASGAYTTEPADGFELNTAGTPPVTVKYTKNGIEKTASFDVTVSSGQTAGLDAIKVTKQPAKTEYTVGDKLDLTGLEVTAVYTDKSEKPVTGYTTSPANGAELKNTGTQTVTVTYKEGDIEKTVSFAVTVNRGGGGGGGGGGGSKTPDPAAESDTTKSPDGTVRTVVKNPDNSVTTTETRSDGTEITTQTTASGNTSAVVTVPGGKGQVTVTIPTSQKPGAGDVAVIVHPDGTREVVKTSVATENGLQVTLREGARLEIVDNSRHFNDTPAASWAAEAVNFVSSREIFTGTSESSFSPNAGMTRAMLMTALYRIDGGTASGNGESWYSDALEWSKEQGLSDGSNPNGNITREQLAAILYRHAGSPAAGGSLESFSDHDQVSDWSTDALRWAVEEGLISGRSDGVLDPGGNATRAEVAAILMRYLSK